MLSWVPPPTQVTQQAHRCLNVGRCIPTFIVRTDPAFPGAPSLPSPPRGSGRRLALQLGQLAGATSSLCWDGMRAIPATRGRWAR